MYLRSKIPITCQIKGLLERLCLWLICKVEDITGLTSSNIKITDEGLNQLIRFYCRESGVRNLRKHIEKIYRKAAYKVVNDKASDLAIDRDNLTDYVGKPVWSSEKMYPATPAGVALGNLYLS